MTSLVIGAVITLVATSAALAAAEAAAFRLGASRLRTLLDEGFPRAAALSRLRSEPGQVRSAVRIVCGGLNLLALGTAMMFGWAWWGPTAATILLVPAIAAVLLLADVLPRLVASRRPVRLALRSAGPLLALRRAATAVTSPFLRLEDALSGDGNGDVSHGEREIREIQELGQERGFVGEEENLLVERAFRLDELTAWDVMTPRVDIFAWKDTTSLEDIVGQLPSVPYSRVPVFGKSTDDVTGILYVREAFETYVQGRRDVTLREISRDPFFVPGSLSLSLLLKSFQARRIHMGIVADEFGGTDGLVTLEDVLEELVGEIVDERDVDAEPIIRVGRNEVVADAGVDLREINDAFNVALPHLDHRSLNGFILEELGHVPSTGEALERAGIRIEVVEASETQVVRARLTRAAPENESLAEREG